MYRKRLHGGFRKSLMLAASLTMLAGLVLSISALDAQAQSAVPVADAGDDQTVMEGTYVVLNGSGSTDDVGIVNYTWTFEYGELPRVLTGQVNDSFRFAIPGTYNVTLNVTDEEGQYDTDVVVITVTAKPVDILGTYWWLFLIAGAVAAIAVFLYLLLKGKISFVSEATREKVRLMLIKGMDITKQVMKSRMGSIGVFILVFFIFLGIFGPALAPYTLDEKESAYMPQSPEHWMGTDIFGQDIFSQLLYGARTSIIVGIFSAVIASFLGAAVGLYSGYAGGWKDEVIMRANDVVLSIPWLVLMIIVAAFLGKIDLLGIILIIGLTGWSFTARMVRAQVLSVKERQYIERARAIGASDFSIIRRHIFPNTFPLVFANTILTVAVSILSEATLSFLGLRPQGAVTWGTMLSYAQDANAFHIGMQWWIIAPGLCIVFIVLGFTLLGYALDDILNPRLRRR